MIPAVPADARFVTSSFCSVDSCVAIAELPDGDVALRDTKDPTRLPFVFDAREWAEFVAGVKNGEFDF